MDEISATIDAYASRLAQAGKSKSGDELVALTIDQMLRGVNERQAAVIRRCAIPRWFDASVLRVLREHDEGNERVLEKLRAYSFVRDLGDGRLAYHDEVRAALLEEWKRERPDELKQIHRRLYSYFSTRTTPLGVSSRAMPLMPDSTALSVVPQTSHADLLRREALYHLLALDQERGLAELRHSFEALEGAHRLAEAELLIQTASETTLGPRERRWVQYLRARALKAALRLEDAGAQLDTLRAVGDLEPELSAEVSRTLGEVYSETGQWARATELYRQSLAYFVRTNNSSDAAETMVLLGEAYQGLGISTGSWYVPSLPANPLLALAHALWVWLLGLPFQIVILLMGRSNRLLPLPEHCARYQNWLLIRLYNTARTWYADARDAFRRMDNQHGLLRAEQRLADILLLYGYHDEARATITDLLARPEARDPYMRAWLQRSLAEAQLAAGDLRGAQANLAEARLVFRELGDLRREATVLTLQGRAATLAGDVAGALRDYEASLERFRALRYAAARERILHELRAWQREPSLDGTTRARVAAVVAAEPEKRYVGRFLRSYQGLLQVATILALPVALLLMALVAPTLSIDVTDQGTLSQTIFFSPTRVLGVLATLTPIYMAVYASIAMTVIYWLPITRIEREQPDLIVTRPEGIARYDSQGNLAMDLPWTGVRRWLALDRCLWSRPLTLYSRTYLEDEAGRDLGIDGITGWYTALQADIGLRLAAVGNRVSRSDLGYRLLRSKAGISVGVGTVLLLLVTSSNNGWLNLRGLVPPSIAAIWWFIALSGALLLGPMAYWLATRPMRLQRTLMLNERWPLFLVALGGLAIVIGLVLVRSGVPVEALGYGLVVWGVYVLAEAVSAMVVPGRRALRAAMVGLALLVTLLAVARPALSYYNWLVGYIARNQVERGVVLAAAGCAAAGQSRELGGDAYAAWSIQGDCATSLGRWEEAAQYYFNAARAAPSGSFEQAMALFNLQQVLGYAGQDRLSAQAAAELLRLCAASPEARPVCDQLNAPR